ncbi:NAD(P)/FAD-dependent oxidoreductase [Acuticoccus kandeliae]|uniref:NAD(P)/FAD-dependent oxidoreductase n=1 Tax=Acuticoccus kandeliae TaxID=2073160 RepID=UPI00130049EA|nr:FAD-dependent oxidoreductase [Acuticoccus kandeliae]
MADPIETHGDTGADASFWHATATGTVSAARLHGDLAVDVAVIGGGITGLSAALHLAEAGASVAVVDAEAIAWGASGRAGGEVLPGLKLDPEGMVRRFGEARGERLAAWAGATTDLVFDLVARHGIDCHARRTGWLQAAYTNGEMKTLEARCRQWQARGAPVEILDREETAKRLGTPPSLYVGAWLDGRGGGIHPLDYTRGLACAAAKVGARLFEKTLARRLVEADGAWRVECDGGTVAADAVIVATNGYTGDLVPGLRRTLIPMRASQAVSAPLDTAAAEAILPAGHVASDRRRLLISFRLSHDGRLILGGPGGTREATGEALLRNAAAAAEGLFGEHGRRLSWDYGWSGQIALTRDFIPHLHEPRPGLLAALGYNGRGIALATALGKLAAERIGGRPAEDLPLPLSEIRPIPLHGLSEPALAVGEAFMGVLDRAERTLGR